MATIEIEIDDEKIQQMLQGDRGMAVLLEPILNQMLQAEMTEHLKAKPGEQTDDRRGYRNGSYERQLTTRRHNRVGGAAGSRRYLPDCALPALSACAEISAR
jgi:transposase-like protein